MARSLTHLHGGTLTASSAGMGQGSTLELSLPLAPAQDMEGSGP